MKTGGKERGGGGGGGDRRREGTGREGVRERECKGGGYIQQMFHSEVGLTMSVLSSEPVTRQWYGTKHSAK